MKHIVFNVYGTHVAHVCMQKKNTGSYDHGELSSHCEITGEFVV